MLPRPLVLAAALVPAGGTAAEFARTIGCDSRKWSKLIKDAGVKPE